MKETKNKCMDFLSQINYVKDENLKNENIRKLLETSVNQNERKLNSQTGKRRKNS